MEVVFDMAFAASRSHGVIGAVHLDTGEGIDAEHRNHTSQQSQIEGGEIILVTRWRN